MYEREYRNEREVMKNLHTGDHSTFEVSRQKHVYKSTTKNVVFIAVFVVVFVVVLILILILISALLEKYWMT